MVTVVFRFSPRLGLAPEIWDLRNSNTATALLDGPSHNSAVWGETCRVRHSDHLVRPTTYCQTPSRSRLRYRDHAYEVVAEAKNDADNARRAAAHLSFWASRDLRSVLWVWDEAFFFGYWECLLPIVILLALFWH